MDTLKAEQNLTPNRSANGVTCPKECKVINATAQKVEVQVPIKPLITLQGVVAIRQATVLKDDGCNKNVKSKGFVRRNRNLLQITETSSVINHSDKTKSE